MLPERLLVRLVGGGEVQHQVQLAALGRARADALRLDQAPAAQLTLAELKGENEERDILLCFSGPGFQIRMTLAPKTRVLVGISIKCM